MIVSVANQGTGIGATTDGKYGDLIFVNFDGDKSGKSLAMTIAHEGSHVADNQDFDDLVRLDMKGSNLADITYFESERRAYNVTSFIAQSLGVSPVFNFPNTTKYHVWNNGWKEADQTSKRTSGINNLLNDRYSDLWFKKRMSDTEIGINPAFLAH